MLFRPDRRWSLQKFEPRRGNAQARAAVIQLVSCVRPRLSSVLVIAGAPACGKSHLLHAATRFAWQKHGLASCSILGARQLADQVVRGELFGDLPKLAAQLATDRLLAVDDVDVLTCYPRVAEFLLAVLQERQIAQRPSLLSASLAFSEGPDNALRRWLDQQPAVFLQRN